MLGDGKCDEACNNWDCTLDNHDCGACASGCFPEMLSNGFCDPECKNYDCYYDYKDCQCAEGCDYLEYGQCKPECLVASCNYDRMSKYFDFQCQDASLMIFSSYQQNIRKDFTYVAHLEDCYSASNNACTQAKVFDLSTCYQECNILECNYSNGNCNSEGSQDSDCLRTYGDGSLGKCMSCMTYALISGECTSNQDSDLIISPDESLVKIFSEDRSTLKNPYIYFVTSVLSDYIWSGDGTFLSPYQDLNSAIKYSNYNYSVIYLKEDGDYQGLRENEIDEGRYHQFIARRKDKLYLKLTTLNGGNITVYGITDYYNYWSLSFSNGILEINNVIFDGKFRECADTEYCEYCPYVEQDWSSSSWYVNDRGEEIWNYVDMDICRKFHDYYFIDVNEGSLIMRNVSFINFRMGFAAIIRARYDSNVLLYNVTFDNIWLANKEEAAVIYLDNDCTNNAEDTCSSSFYYEIGKVSRLNNGYEYNDPLSFRGFLYVKNIIDINIIKVEFGYNLVYSYWYDDIETASLLTLFLFQKLEIESCIFSYNYCELGIINIQNDGTIPIMETNDRGVVKYSALRNIQIKKSFFSSNYVKNNGLISIRFEGKAQNILINSTSFEANGVKNNGLIYISSEDEENLVVYDQDVEFTTSSGLTTTAKYLASWLKVLNSKFINNFSGDVGLIEIRRMANVEITYTQMDRNGGSPSTINDFNSILLKYFIKNPDIYLKIEASSTQNLWCFALSSIWESVNFAMKHLNATNNYCEHWSPSIIIARLENVTLDHLYFKENNATSTNGICLAFGYLKTATISNSEFSWNKNNFQGGPGAIEFAMQVENLTLINSTFTGNSAGVGGAVYFSGFNINIDNCKFESNSIYDLSGGALYLSLASQEPNAALSIFDTIFYNNSCTKNGGAVYVSQKSISSSITSVLITNITFSDNKASYGSGIYFDESINLSDNIQIMDSTFHNNSAAESGAFYIQNINIGLFLSNTKFIENTAKTCSSLHVSKNQNANKKLSLNQCSFQSNFGLSTVLVDSSKDISLETDNCLFEYNKGTTFLLYNTIINDNNSTFQHGYSSSSGAVIMMKNSVKMHSVNTKYINNTSELNGGAISVSENSKFSCFSCNFIENKANGSGGAIYADTYIEIKDSKFLKNSCQDEGSALKIVRASKKTTIQNCEISENHSLNTGSIFVLFSEIDIDSSIIKKNTANGDNPGIILDDSKINILNVSFSSQEGKQGCFIKLKSGSFALIQNSSFTDSHSSNSGTAIYSLSSATNISNSIFSDLSSNNGGVFFIYKESSILINDSIIENIKGSSIDSYASFIKIQNTQFINNENSAIVGSGLHALEIFNSEFSGCLGANGGGLYCSQCQAISVDSCLFRGNTGSSTGGAIYITTDTSIENLYNISSTKFLYNKALVGGALSIKNSNISVYNCEFIENSARSSGNYQNGKIDGTGGAIDTYCEDFGNCIFNVSSNIFNKNRAENNGGAINWNDVRPILENNIFISNSAIYGDNISSYAVKMISLDNTYNGNQTENHHLMRNLELKDIASGQQVNQPLAFALVDHYDQIIKTDNTSRAELQTVGAGVSLLGSTNIHAVNGTFIFTNYTIIALPGSSVQLKVYSSVMDSSDQASDIYISATLRLCKTGEATINMACVACGESYYSFNTSDAACLPCPDHAICYGNYSMVPKPGYWREEMYSLKFWKCPRSSSCLGSPDPNNLSYTGVCDKGYTGKLCHSCQDRYARLYKNKCKNCPDTVENIFRALGMTGVIIAIIFIIIKAERKSLLYIKISGSAYIRIFWDYLHILIIIAAFTLNWPDEVLQLFYVASSLNYINEELFSFDCFFQSENSRNKIYYDKIILTSLSPIILGSLCLIIWIIYYLLKRKSFRAMIGDFTITFIVLLYLIHPHAIGTLFSIYSCKEINSGQFWLNYDLGIKCWTYDHTFYAFLIALPGIIIWGVAAPIFCLTKIIRHRKRLEEIFFKQRYAFLYQSFKPQRFYWEFIIIYSKIILVILSVFLENIPDSIQGFIITIILLFFLHIHNRNSPFTEPHLNQVEFIAKFVLLLTIFSGLFFSTKELDYSRKIAIFVITLISNISFIVYILCKIFKEQLKIPKQLLLWLINTILRRSRSKLGGSIILDVDSTQIATAGVNKNLNFTAQSKVINSSQDFESESLHVNSGQEIMSEADPCPSPDISIFSGGQGIY
ncbi:unnamed protein product [Blepharisma stoltei]|uniref:Uncharacterized protein n=1 Tax=Blepharisma stoltei TaxID=1481888 RepID=A0AAU9JAS0_9CILI|nr:unnamed protein product [Blepharisma stoltei]